RRLHIETDLSDGTHLQDEGILLDAKYLVLAHARIDTKLVVLETILKFSLLREQGGQTRLQPRILGFDGLQFLAEVPQRALNLCDARSRRLKMAVADRANGGGASVRPDKPDSTQSRALLLGFALVAAGFMRKRPRRADFRVHALKLVAQ